MEASKKQGLWNGLFIVYMIWLLAITVRPWAITGESFLKGSLNFKLFAEYVQILEKKHIVRALYLFLGNIAVFIPFGMYLEYRKPNMDIRRIVLCGFLFSLAIECAQYVLGTGYSELDDLILNTVGAGVGGRLRNWNKVRFITGVCTGVSVFVTILSLFFLREPSMEDAIADIQSGRYQWFTLSDSESFDGRYLAKQEEDTMPESGLKCVRIDIYDTETDELLDSIYVEALWGFRGIFWEDGCYNLWMLLPDGSTLCYRYKGGGWYKVEDAGKETDE